MSLYLTLFEGSTPADARPLMAISDPAIVETVLTLLVERLEQGRVPHTTGARILTLVKPPPL